jgi:hypothetical protein
MVIAAAQKFSLYPSETATIKEYIDDKTTKKEYLEYGLYFEDELVGCIVSYTIVEGIRYCSCWYVEESHRLQAKMFFDTANEVAVKDYKVTTLRCVANNPHSLQVLSKLGFITLYTVLNKEL